MLRPERKGKWGQLSPRSVGDDSCPSACGADAFPHLCSSAVPVFFFPLVKAGLSPGVHASAFSLCRGRFRMKEREEMWQKIEELARLNPQVGSSRTLGQTRQEYAGGVSASFLSSREQL